MVHVMRGWRFPRWAESCEVCQAGEIHVLGCDQKVQKLSTEKILYTCNKLG